MRKHHWLEGSSLNKKPYIRPHLILFYVKLLVVKYVESIYEIEIVVPVLFFGFGFVWIMVNQVDLTYLIRLIV